MKISDKNANHSLTPEKIGEMVQPTLQKIQEQLSLTGNDLGRQLASLLREGNSHRLLVKQCNGHVLLEVPLTFGIVGGICFALLTPFRWTIITTVLVLFLRIYIVVEPYEEPIPVTVEAQPASPTSRKRRVQTR